MQTVVSADPELVSKEERRRQRSRRPFWVGGQLICPICECHFILEAEDAKSVQLIDSERSLERFWAPCPVCETRCMFMMRNWEGPDTLAQYLVTDTREVPYAPHFSEIPQEGVDLDALLDHYERAVILSALRAGGGVKRKAARLLKITYRSLRYRVDKYKI